MTRPAISLIQLTMAGYRQKFVEELRREAPGRILIAAGDIHFDESLTLGVSEEGIDIRLKNRFFAGRRLCFQSGVVGALRGTKWWVVELNPRIITSWLVLLVARFSGRHSYVWGHYLGRSLGDTAPRMGRRLQVKLARGVVAYTHEDAAKFRARFPRSRVVVAANSVDLAREIAPATGGHRNHYLCVGRLTSSKNFELVINGFALATKQGRLPKDVRLVIVGSGPSEVSIRETMSSSGVADMIDLRRGTFDQSELDMLYDQAIAAVCGGSVGLNITQSLTRGVPMVFPKNACHGPEVVLARPGWNSFPFEQETAEAVADALEAAALRSASTGVSPLEIQRHALSQYSVESMVEGFLSVADL